MKKRIVSLLLALVMMTSLLPVQVFAVDAEDAAAEPVVEQQQEEKQEEKQEEVPAQESAKEEPAQAAEPAQQEPVAAVGEDTPAPLADDGAVTIKTPDSNGMTAFTLSVTPSNPEAGPQTSGYTISGRDFLFLNEYTYTVPAGTKSVTVTFTISDPKNGFCVARESGTVSFADFTSLKAKPEDVITETTVTLMDGKGSSPCILTYLVGNTGAGGTPRDWTATKGKVYQFHFEEESATTSLTRDLPERAVYNKDAAAEPLQVTVSAPEGSDIQYTWYQGATPETVSTVIDGANTNAYTPSTAEAGVTYYRVAATVTEEDKNPVTLRSTATKVVVKSADVAFTVQTYSKQAVTAVSGSQTVFRTSSATYAIGKVINIITGTIPDGMTIDRIWSGSPADSYDLTKDKAVSIDYDTNTFTVNLLNAGSEADAATVEAVGMVTNPPQRHRLGRCLYLQTSDGTVYTLVIDSSVNTTNIDFAPSTVQLVDDNQYVLNDFQMTTLRTASTSVVSGTLRSETPVVLRAQSFGSGVSLTNDLVKEKAGYAAYWNEAQESWVLVNGQQIGGICYGGTEEHPAESSAFTLRPGLNVVEVYTNIKPFNLARTREANVPGLSGSVTRSVGSKWYTYSPTLDTNCVVYLIDYQGTSAESVPQDDMTNTALRDVVALRFGADKEEVAECPLTQQNDGTYLLTLPQFYHTNEADSTYYTHAVLMNAKPETPGAAAVITSSTQGLVLGKSLANSAFLDIETLYGITDPSFTITVTAADGTTKRDYTVKVAYANSSTDTEITVSGPTLDAAFDKDIYTYYLNYTSAAAAEGTMQITLPKGATATVNGEAHTGGTAVALDPKQDFYRVTVTAEDGITTVSYYFVTRYADGTIPYVSIPSETKALAKEMLSGWYNNLAERTYFPSYWNVFMAMATGNADGSEYDFTNAYVEDPARHGAKQATDWAACIMEIVMLGRNPYDFPRYVNGQYVEHFDYVQGLIDQGGGAWGNNVWYHMASKAAGAQQKMLYSMKLDAVDATWNLDIRGWSIASLENCVETKDMVRYVDSLHNVQDTSGKYTSLWTDQSWHSASSGNAYTIGCVLSGIAAGGGDPEKLFAYDGHTPLQTIKETIYNAETGMFKSSSGQDVLPKDMVIGLGDILHGSNVWARYTLTEQKYNDLIAKAKNLNIATDAMPAYQTGDTTVGKAYYGLYDTVATALEAKGDYSMRPQVTFGMPHELFIDAVNAMPSADALTVSDLTKLEDLIEQYEALDDASREAVVSVNAAAMTKYQALVAAGLKLKGSDNAADLYEKIMALPKVKDVTAENVENVKADVAAIRKAMTEADKKLLAWAGDSVLAKLEAVADAAGAPKPSITVTFQLLGDTKHSGNDADIHTYRFNKDELQEWIETVTVTVPEGSTVGDVFRKVLGEKNMSSSGADSGYVSVINDLAAQTNTTFSGWMYLVNGKHPQVGLNQYVLKDKDAIVWHWTDDYQLEDDEVYHNAGRVKKYIENLIALIGEVDTSTSCKARIDKARAAYDKLSKAEQDTIKTAQTLVDAETKYASLVQAEADKKAADDVIKLITGIGKVDKNSKSKIDAARAAYDKLTKEQQKLVPKTTLDALEAAEKAYADLDKNPNPDPTPTPTPGGNTGNNSSAKNPYQKDNKTDSKADGKDVKSGNTGDAGVTLYVGMGLVAVLAGAVVITRKRKEN